MTAHAESPVDSSTLYQRPVELLQNLIRFDTTNPPGTAAAGRASPAGSRDPRRPADGREHGLAPPSPKDQLLRQVLDPQLTDTALDQLGPTGRLLDPLLHNTVSPTILHGSDKINVIPCEVSVELDGRLLPGYTDKDMLSELGQLLGDEVELTVIKHEAGPPEADMGLFETLSGILKEADPDGTPGPLLVSGGTDARHFARLGIQTYGFTPMSLPPGLDIFKLAHGPDERVPVEALSFGTEAIYKLMERFGDAI